MSKKDLVQNIEMILSDSSKVDALSLKEVEQLIKAYPYFAELYVIRSQKMLHKSNSESAQSMQSGLLRANNAVSHVKTIYQKGSDIAHEEKKIGKKSKTTQASKATSKSNKPSTPAQKPKATKADSPVTSSVVSDLQKEKATSKKAKSKKTGKPIEEVQTKVRSKSSASQSKKKGKPKGRKAAKNVTKRKSQDGLQKNLESKQSYVEWLKHIDGANKSKKSLQKNVENSVKQNEQVVSESLAKLYKKQGLLDQSIEIYEKLILVYPEKSSFFAAQIQKLKKL